MKPGRHIRTVCNYTYEEPDRNKEKAVAFDQLPADWKCPSCFLRCRQKHVSALFMRYRRLDTCAHSHTGQKAHR